MEKDYITFTIMAFAINALYSVLAQKLIITPTLYFIFNYFVIVVYRAYAKDIQFQEGVLLSLRLTLLVQITVSIIGAGRITSSRYSGTFNDPNQFAFYVFIAFLMMYSISQNNIRARWRIRLYDYIIVIYLIIRSASTGVFLGLCIFIVLTTIYSFRKMNTTNKVASVFAILICALGIFMLTETDTFINLFNNQMVNRVVQKTAKYIPSENMVDFQGIMAERGLIRIIREPWYLLFGSGEGAYERFGSVHEIHSTFPGLLFCYGIIPFVFIMRWIKRNIIRLDRHNIPPLIALFVESMLLSNYRQPLFWLLFVEISVWQNKDENSKSILKRA